MVKVSTHATQSLMSGGRHSVAWLIGTGFLTLHAAAFFAALVILIPWNLYQSPGDFWVARPLQSWAFLLAFHAIVVGAISLARGIIRSPATATPQNVSPGQESGWGRSASQRRSLTTGSFQNSTRSSSSSVVAEEWAQRWFDDSPMNGQGSNAWQGQGGSSVPASPAEGREVDLHPVTTSFRKPVSWPAPPPAREPVAAEADYSEEESEVVIHPGRLDPLHAAADMQSRGDEEIDPELEWQWVEAAASAWLSRPSSKTTPSNGHHPHHYESPDNSSSAP
jgi:hypothetical protein